MPTPRRLRRLWDTYRFPGFRPSTTVVGIFGDPHARVLTLTRRSKKRPAGRAGACSVAGTTASGAASAIWPVGTCASTSRSKSGGWPPRRRVPPAQDPHLHAAGAVTVLSYLQVPQTTHTTSRRPGEVMTGRVRVPPEVVTMGQQQATPAARTPRVSGAPAPGIVQTNRRPHRPGGGAGVGDSVRVGGPGRDGAGQRSRSMMLGHHSRRDCSWT